MNPTTAYAGELDAVSLSAADVREGLIRQIASTYPPGLCRAIRRALTTFCQRADACQVARDEAKRIEDRLDLHLKAAPLCCARQRCEAVKQIEHQIVEAWKRERLANERMERR